MRQPVRIEIGLRHSNSLIVLRLIGQLLHL
jgi:hypothetical protein